MPTPREGESQKDYVSRCIPIVLKEGTAKDENQAAAICYSMYKEKHKQDDYDIVTGISGREYKIHKTPPFKPYKDDLAGGPLPPSERKGNYPPGEQKTGGMGFAPDPKPTTNEAQDKFLRRCIPEYTDIGYDPEYAQRVCQSIWDQTPRGAEDDMPRGEAGGRSAEPHPNIINMSMFNPPMPIKGENVDQFIERCKPVVESHGYPAEMAKGCCLGCWDDWLHDEPTPPLPDRGQDGKPQYPQKPWDPDMPVGPSGDGTQYSKETRELYMFDMDCDHAVSFIDEEKTELKDDVNKETNKFTAVAVKGDTFYKGKFLSFAEIDKAHKTMDGAYHDINHWGTSYPVDGHPNIEYIIGYQKNTTVDKKNKIMKTDIIVNPEAPHYKAWKNFVDINKQVGRKPNVSVSFWASNKKMKAKDLPVGTDYTQEGYKADDDVPVLYDIGFQALSTVFKGACDDTQGCGIGLSDNEEHLRLTQENYQLRILKEEKTL